MGSCGSENFKNYILLGTNSFFLDFEVKCIGGTDANNTSLKAVLYQVQNSEARAQQGSFQNRKDLLDIISTMDEFL